MIARLWEGLLLAWGSRACWGYRALVHAPVFLLGVAAIAAAGFLAHLTGFVPAVLVVALCAGALTVLTRNGVIDASLLVGARVEHGLLLVELSRKRETPGGREQVAWARQRSAAADAPPAWVVPRVRRAVNAVHGNVHDVGDVFPAFARGRAPSWARRLLARCTNPMADALAARAFAGESGRAAAQAREGLLLYAAVWDDAFRWNMALWCLGQVVMLLVAALAALPLALAVGASHGAVLDSAVAVALWTGFAVQRVVAAPILEAAAIVAFEEMVQGSSVPPETEPRLREASAAFRDLDDRARDMPVVGGEHSL